MRSLSTMQTLIVFAAILSLPSLSFSKTIHVPDDYPTIQEAIDAAVHGDLVLVAGGTYTENIDFLGKAITVKSLEGPSATRIDGNQAGSVVTFANQEGLDSVLQGFELTHGQGMDWGGGILCDENTSPTIRNNIIQGNSAIGGGAIFCAKDSSPLITENTISENTSINIAPGIYCDHATPTISNNLISQNTTDGMGGGIVCVYGSHAWITDNIIQENASSDSSGIYCQTASPLIENNTISGNKVTHQYGRGGGIVCSAYASPIILNNTISDNLCTGDYGKGGGIYVSMYSAAEISGNRILNNSVTGLDSKGGGIYCESSSPLITNNTLKGNVAYDGGGICLYPSNYSFSISNNTLSGNEAYDRGGGIFTWASDVTIENNTLSYNSTGYSGAGIYCHESSPKILNNTIYGNMALAYHGLGGGIFCWASSATLTNNTLAKNSATNKGGGIYCTYISSPTLTNCILWENDAPQGPEIWIGGTPSYPSFLNISYSDVMGGQASVYVKAGSTLVWGPGMINGDPCFVDAVVGDFHLLYTSPCMNSGTNQAPFLPDQDFEEDPRIAHGMVDMGSDEFYTHLYYTGDATPGGSIEVKLTDLPQKTPVMLWIGSDVLDPPWPTPYGNWHLQFPILLELSLGEIPWPEGMLLLPYTFPPDFPAPWDIPLQALIQDKVTNLCIMHMVE